MMMITIDFFSYFCFMSPLLIDHLQDIFWVLVFLTVCWLKRRRLLLNLSMYDVSMGQSFNLWSGLEFVSKQFCILRQEIFLKKLFTRERRLNCTWNDDWWWISCACRATLKSFVQHSTFVVSACKESSSRFRLLNLKNWPSISHKLSCG